MIVMVGKGVVKPFEDSVDRSSSEKVIAVGCDKRKIYCIYGIISHCDIYENHCIPKVLNILLFLILISNSYFIFRQIFETITSKNIEAYLRHNKELLHKQEI